MKILRILLMAVVLFLSCPDMLVAATLEDLLVEKGIITKDEARTITTPAPPRAKVYWNEGTRVEIDDTGFTAKVNADVLSRYTYSDNEGGADASSFSVERARLTLSGSILYGEFSYKLEGEFTDGSDPLRDAFLEWHACDFSGIRMGQFKPLISRQFNTPYTKLLLPNRSIVSDFFTLDRNQGIQGSIDLTESVILTGQFMNGISDDEGINSRGIDTSHTSALGLRAHLIGEGDSFSESDIDHEEGMLLDAGFAVAMSEATRSLVQTDITTVSTDVNFKRAGLSVNGEFFYQENDPDSDDSTHNTGFYVQSGYFLTPKAFEVAARYSNLNCDNGRAASNGFTTDISSMPSCVGNDSMDAVDIGFNYYWWKHHLKAQFAWMRVSEDALTDPDRDTDRWIFQLSGWF